MESMSQDRPKYSEESIAQRLGLTYGIYRGCHCGPNIQMMGSLYTYQKSNWRGWYEADFLFITKSGYLWEIEIKISIQDFRADLRKKYYHDHPDVRGFYYCMPYTIYEAHREEVKSVCKEKGAGLYVVDRYGGLEIIIKPKERKDVPPLDIYEKLEYLKLFAKKWI